MCYAVDEMTSDREQLASRSQLLVPRVALTVRMVISRRIAAMVSFSLVDKKLWADGFAGCISRNKI